MSVGFWEGLGLGTVGGMMLTDILKNWVANKARRLSEKDSNQRKLLREDIEALSKRVDPLLTSAQEYYGKPSHLGKSVASKIKADLKSFAADWNAVDGRIQALKLQSIGLSPLVSLRKALTGVMDEVRAHALDFDDPRALQIFHAAVNVKDVLSNAKYSAA